MHALVDSVQAAESAVAGGATVLQVRLKGVSTAARADLGRGLRHLPAMLVINDDVEAALRCGADGVHLGQSDGGAHRALAAGLVLGISVATVDEAEDAQTLGAAYLGAGPVWATPTKSDAAAPIGVAGLAAICAAARIPVVAIGGIDAGNAGSCIEAGAAGVAVVRAAQDAAGLRAAVDAALRVTART
ncbi:MAG TPA: thiamine phosphate synthase [Candidatus Dormibacteraeota bacterium]|nr:thiamine phosphate synthase [Candidatus Dormibacteraeota bacterium]